jgi:hypothetical protein
VSLYKEFTFCDVNLMSADNKIYIWQGGTLLATVIDG